MLSLCGPAPSWAPCCSSASSTPPLESQGRNTALPGRYWRGTAQLDVHNLFSAAMEIALDRSASTPARVYPVCAGGFAVAAP